MTTSQIVIATGLPALAAAVQTEQEQVKCCFPDPSAKKDASDVLRDAVHEWHTEPATAKKKYGDIKDWDTSEVTTMTALFDCTNGGTPWTIQGDISKWDTSKVEDMSTMFAGQKNFTQDLSLWDTSNVKAMTMMFANCDIKDSGLNSWNVASVGLKVNSKLGVFSGMVSMFYNATNFDGDLSKWDTKNVNAMDSMFQLANKFSHHDDVEKWNITSLQSADAMFSDSKLAKHAQLCHKFEKQLNLTSDKQLGCTVE